MAKKKPDQRAKSVLRRVTEREYGGASGYRSPTTQDTGKAFGRGGARPHRPLRPFGKGV